MKRSHKKMDEDVKGLGMILCGCSISSQRMVRASLLYAWDKYIISTEKLRASNGGGEGEKK